MRYLIAGGAGFLGSHLAESLLNSGNKVVVIDNLLTGRMQNIQLLEADQNFSFKKVDIVNESEIKAVGKEEKIDGIFHLASPASPNVNSPKSYMQFPIETMLVNSVGTCNLLKLANEHKAKFLYASSSEVYGEPKIHPQTEDYFGNVNPDGPRSCYDEGKRFGEAMCYSFKRKFNQDIRIVRIFNTYGPKMDPKDGRVVSNFIVSALKGSPLTIYGKGNQTRSFCYVDDLVSGLITVMEKDAASGEVFNLGNDKEFTILELAELVKKLINPKLEFKFDDLPTDDPTRRRPDLSKIRSILGYNPSVGLEEGLQKTIDYFKKETL